MGRPAQAAVGHAELVQGPARPTVEFTRARRAGHSTGMRRSKGTTLASRPAGPDRAIFGISTVAFQQRPSNLFVDGRIWRSGDVRTNRTTEAMRPALPVCGAWVSRSRGTHTRGG